MRKWLPVIILASGFGILIAFCAGVIRPPRPMFHNTYAAGGFGLLPTWQPGPSLVDDHGQWLRVDEDDNLLVIHATGTAAHSRSHPMTAGVVAARFRLGSAGADEPERQYVRIPRTRDSLIVILSEGRREAFPIGPGQATRFFREEIQRETLSPDLLKAARSILDGETIARIDAFLKEYTPPVR
jgi:hypothetical protein